MYDKLIVCERIPNSLYILQLIVQLLLDFLFLLFGLVRFGIRVRERAFRNAIPFFVCVLPCIWLLTVLNLWRRLSRYVTDVDGVVVVVVVVVMVWVVVVVVVAV